MKNLQLYKILSYILLPFGGLFAVVALFGILVALGNPLMLISLFFIACVALYIFSSFKFFNKGILQQIKCKPSLKDFVRVNAFVTILFCALSVFNTISVLSNPEIIKQATQQMLQMQSTMQAGINAEMLTKTFKAVTIGFGILSVALLAHAVLSLRFLKEFNQIFTEE